jgi:hypothetical protein
VEEDLNSLIGDQSCCALFASIYFLPTKGHTVILGDANRGKSTVDLHNCKEKTAIVNEKNSFLIRKYTREEL